MESKTEFERSFFLGKIFSQIGGGLYVPPYPDDILPLGDAYHASMTKLYRRRSEMFDGMVRHLSRLTDQDLQQAFSPDGRAVSESAIDWASQCKRDIRLAFGRVQPWYQAALFRTKGLADYDHWSRSAFLKLDEVVWLSVGLEPAENLKELIRPNKDTRNSNGPSPVATYMSRHREQIRREFDPHGYNANLDAEPLLEWMNLVKFPVHPKFADMLGGMVALKGKVIEETTMTPVVLPPQTSTLDGRERVSLAKLITALAIDAYGFDPSQKRSPIPNEIASIAERLGLRVSNDTIRKYLKIGSENLPEGWRD